MEALSSSAIIDLWERGVRLHALDRSLLAVGAALPETPYENIADWPLGRRNRALAGLLSRGFGVDVEAWTTCPGCGEKLEFRLDSGVLATQAEPAPERSIAVNGRLFRLPSSRDLASAIRETDPELAALRLLKGCLLKGELPERKDLEEVGEQMALADPLAEIRLTFRCSNCGHEWEETLDLGAIVWSNIEWRARRLLQAVHALGSAYGWTEKEILSLSEPRRSLYLEMIQA